MNGLQNLVSYVSEDILSKVLSSFSSATGLHAIIVDCEGRTLLPKGMQDDCAFCRLIKNDPVGCNKCRGSYARAGMQAAQYGEPYIFRCHAGLVAFAAPIVIDGNLLGSIICGQVLMWEPEDFFWEEISDMTAGLNIKQELLMETAGQLEVITGRKVQAAADMLFVVANNIMQSGAVSLQQRREIALRQMQLSEEIHYRKRLEKKLAEVEDGIYGNRSLQMERELIAAVRVGDREGAYSHLTELVSVTVGQFISKPNVFKARMVELSVVLSRSAAEGGADREELQNINCENLAECARYELVDELSNWIFKVLDRLIQCVRGNVKVKYLNVIERARDYIRKHYHTNITLNDIAQACYVSPYHLSHIFKEQLNCTVMDYLTLVRLEQAKSLLGNTTFTINDIAEKTGYNDPGYFCKVFKKNEGITPSAFKKQLG